MVLIQPHGYLNTPPGCEPDAMVRRERLHDLCHHPDSNLQSLCAFSPYLFQHLTHTHKTLEPWLTPGRFQNGLKSILDHLGTDIDQVSEQSMPEAMTTMRQHKQSFECLLAYADLAGLLPLQESMRLFSRLAELEVVYALSWLLAERHASIGIEDPHRSGVFVLALGKLGGHELNYCSDIDLVMIYDPEAIEASRRERAQLAAVRLAADLARMLEERTPLGHVFRTDYRLRPDPASIPLAVSLDTALVYYSSTARNWERQAFIRARPIAGDMACAQRFLDDIDSFIWRRSMDFEAIREIKTMRRRIASARPLAPGTAFDVKLDTGGIREIEFLTQGIQMIWGGRNRALRTPSTLEALQASAQLELISPAQATSLTGDYIALRHLEHRIQLREGLKTHLLSAKADERARIIAIMGGTHTFEDELMALRQRTIATGEATLFHQEGASVFHTVSPDGLLARVRDYLKAQNFQDIPHIAPIIADWLKGHTRATQAPRAQELMADILPDLLAYIVATKRPQQALVNLNAFLMGLNAGVLTLSLLSSHPSLLAMLVRIMGDFPALAKTLERQPGLLECLLEPSDLICEADRLETLQEAYQRTLKPIEDRQRWLDTINRLTAEYRFRAAIDLIRNASALALYKQRLTLINEAVIAATVAVVQEDFARTAGSMSGAFAVLGLGRQSAGLMHPHSDADLIWLYDDDHDNAPTWYSRMCQRLTTHLSCLTQEGALLTIDLRLRPEGNKATIATSLARLISYFERDIQGWELLMLTRARVLCAEPRFAQTVLQHIHHNLIQTAQRFDLKQDLATMRQHLATHKPPKTFWDIKTARGGLLDAELVIHCLQLLHAPQHPHVLTPRLDQALATLDSIGALEQSATLWEDYQFMDDLLCCLRLTYASDDPEVTHGADSGWAWSLEVLGLETLDPEGSPAGHLARLEARLQLAYARTAQLFEGVIGPHPLPESQPQKLRT